MGLDQYFYLRKGRKEENNKKEIAYLRKANALQGYFETVYDLDNCQHIEITDEVLNDLENRLNGTMLILEKYAKNEESLRALDDYKNVDYSEETEEKLKDYFEQDDEIDAELKSAYQKGKAFYPQSGFFYGGINIIDFILWQLPQIRAAIEAVITAYDNLKNDESIFYYAWW